MKYAISLGLIISFIGVAIFGSVLLDMGPNHSGGCIASVVDGTACPTNSADFAAHHMFALQSFAGTAVTSIFQWLMLLASVLLVSIAIALLYKNVLRPEQGFSLQRFRDLALDSPHSRQTITSWLSLFELSPAI